MRTHQSAFVSADPSTILAAVGSAEFRSLFPTIGKAINTVNNTAVYAAQFAAIEKT